MVCHRQGLQGKRPALAACLAFAVIRFSSPMLAFIAAPPSSGSRLPGVGVAAVRRSWSSEGASERSAVSTSAAAALAACVAAFGAATLSSRRSRASGTGPATALKACFEADASFTSFAPAQFCFAGGASSGPNSATITSSVSRQMLMPKNIKWKKPHKPCVKPYGYCNKWKYRGEAWKGNKPHFGKYALQIMEEAWVKSRNIEAMRRLCVSTMERKGRLWIRVFPHHAITKRTAESRMGAGKGSIEEWVCAVRPGFILFEIDAVEEKVARLAFLKCQKFMPFKTRFIIKADGPSMFELGLAGISGKKVTNIPLEYQKGQKDSEKKVTKAAPKKKPK
ncbi:unnamed protein product [Polarella glacialis]|uniref:Ribosomal protein L10e/L16 domain-containing protein n=1 Tax=Polarella glacialis TaxID=89957 RepID=A0A813IGA1_POLGL|nr:unnamed protein product [Polarella glacialis]CAE8649433.1 unnamed protein product [Polarella glacialis]